MSTRRFRKRQQSSSSESDESGSDQGITAKTEQLRQKKQTRGLHQCSKAKKIAYNNDSSSSADNEEDELSSAGRYKSTRSGKSEAPTDMGATATINIDTQQDRDHQALLKKAKEAKEKESGSNCSFYAGNFMQQDAPRTNQRYGPQRAPLNIRATTRWDYAPDICKDYKETGTCGFGDSCKFLHDRSDHKFGWQIEREYAAGTYGTDDNVSHEIFEDDETEAAGKAPEEDQMCAVCGETCVNPVRSRCEHLFCENCFLSKVIPQKECPSCYVPTDGYAKYITQAKGRIAT